MKIYGRNLEIGDSIEVWWCREDRGQERNPNTDNPIDIITDLVEYKGSLNKTCFKKGARTASFMYGRVGMTIPNDEIYEVSKRALTGRKL